MSLLRDVIDNLFKSVRAFRGAVQTVLLSNGFWHGRQWRAYKEFTLAAGQSLTIRYNSSVPFLLQNQELYLDSGAVRAVIYTAPTTEPGPWQTLPTRFGKYLLAGPGVFQSVLDFSLGAPAITGGNEREVLRASAGGGNNAAFDRQMPGWRALPALTYYIVITATTNASGVYSIEIEELDPT